MSQRPKPSDVPKIAADLRTVAAWLDHYGEAFLNARGTELFSAGGGGHGLRRGSDVSDPTGNAAAAGVDGGWLIIEQTRLTSYLDTLLDTGDAVVTILDSGRRRLWPEGAALGDEGERCEAAAQGCQEDREPGEGGFCKRCAQWRRDHKHSDGTKRAEVSAEYLAQRNERDKRRRVRVSGPLIDGEAVA